MVFKDWESFRKEKGVIKANKSLIKWCRKKEPQLLFQGVSLSKIVCRPQKEDAQELIFVFKDSHDPEEIYVSVAAKVIRRMMSRNYKSTLKFKIYRCKDTKRAVTL